MTFRRLIGTAAALLLLLNFAPSHAQQAGGVITTNYPKPGDTQAAPAIRILLLPSYGDYSNAETDPVAVTAAERDAALVTFKQAAGVNVVSLNRFEDAREGSPDLQIVNNVALSLSTYTLILPPGWTKSAKLPVVLSGNGAGVGNNQRLWKEQDTLLIGIIGKTAGPGRTAIIGAISNAGGTESQGIDENSLKSVGAFFDFIGKNGGDPQKGITAGGSRGGGTALLWAINPLNLPYTINAVFADVPPTAYGTLGQRSVLTYPNLGYIYVAATHLPNAYLYSSPKGPGKQGLGVLIGSDDPAAADARSPFGLAEKLKGKLVVIARGTHDAFFPLWEFLRFDRHLNELGITHTTFITLGQGHSATSALAAQASAYLHALSQGKAYQPPAGRFYAINTNPPTGEQVPLAAWLTDPAAAKPESPTTPGGELPFAAEIPAGAGVGNPVDIAVCGAVGATYNYAASGPDGKQWVANSGTFDASECVTVTVKAPDVAGEYTWTFTYQGKPISPLNTPQRNQGGCGLPALTNVTTGQPSPAELTGGEPSLGFGVDQYSAQDAACLAN